MLDSIINFLRFFLKTKEEKAALNATLALEKIIAINAAYLQTEEGAQVKKDLEAFLSLEFAKLDSSPPLTSSIEVKGGDESYPGNHGKSMYISS